MLPLMNAGGVRRRAIPAPMVRGRAPPPGGAPAVPWPSPPWHLAHALAYTRAPAAVSAASAAHFASRLDTGAGATGTSRDRNHRYATMSRMSEPSVASATPFMLRREQSLIRDCRVSTVALRGRYCG